MHVYLKHAVHGTKVAISEMEVEADEKNGWEVFDPSAPAPVETAPANELEVRRRRKTEA
jgi:hypothetical protein